MTAAPMPAIFGTASLSERQKRFILEYLVDLNGAQAAIRAGYAVSSARAEAGRQLANVNVYGAIQAEMEARGERTRITADRVLREIGKIAFGDIRNTVSWGPDTGVTLIDSELIDDDTAACIQEVSEKKTIAAGKRKGDDDILTIQTKLKLHDKLKALELCARHLGLFEPTDGDSTFKRMSTVQLIKIVKEALPNLENEGKPEKLPEMEKPE